MWSIDLHHCRLQIYETRTLFLSHPVIIIVMDSSTLDISIILNISTYGFLVPYKQEETHAGEGNECPFPAGSRFFLRGTGHEWVRG